MSMPGACLLLQSTRCTRFPQESSIAVPSGAPSAITSLSWPAAGTHIAVPNTDASSLIDNETVPANDPIATRTHSQISLEYPAQTAATRLSQAPAAISTDTLPSSVATTATTDSLSAFTTSYLPSVQHEHVPLSSQTSTQTPSLSSSQLVQPSSTGHSEYLLGAASLITSAPQTSLPISTASTAIPTTAHVTSSNHTTSADPVDFPHDSSSNTPLRTILGSVLGGLAFVALALVLGYYFMSSKRRTGRGSPSLGTSEEGFTAEKIPTVALPGGASCPGYQSRRSFLSESSSSVRSLPIHVARVPVSKPEYTYYDPRSSAIPSAANANPFVEPLEFTYKSTSSRGTTVQSDRVMRNPFADPYPNPGIVSPTTSTSTSTHLRRSQMSQQQRPVSIAWGGSVYSGGDVSLGSTLILPNGRSSAGSSLLNRLSYPFTVNELSDAGGGEGYYDPGARVSTRSDPFDLEYPVKAAVMHRRSSTTIPLAQV
ncbi:uncharacterized protein BO95DRAFT_222337 [Aspergillus brunneoviolaceus CBS 621.78]|uniref:Uncharacterized protein n=1 Tax=Aspergillus brunneoviolaceus CBS 621.78 TaxID=1450534 RepID=A0ACD1GLK8_9EURO|nr:hypothetical protein BO95DRAFT_222337 [Aspergillus brunneoviolaceus CBS 621.78]RAH50123.1 hypothetical protein BO95DRAFT_222337 [Aspergillus brunneoviolaceus CBS 621.78]